MSDYEKERDTQYRDATALETHWFNLGADWSHSRSENEIEAQKQKNNDLDKHVRHQENQLTQCHAIIEVLESALTMNLENAECRSDEDCDHCVGVVALQSLSEFKKSINEGVK